MLTAFCLVLEVNSLHERASVVATFCEFCFHCRNSKMNSDQNYTYCLEILKQCQLLQIVERLLSVNFFVGHHSPQN